MSTGSMAYGSASETGATAAQQSAAAVPESVAAVIDKGGFGVFQKQLLMILGLAWIADSMEVMIVSTLGTVLSSYSTEQVRILASPQGPLGQQLVHRTGLMSRRARGALQTYDSAFVFGTAFLCAALVSWP